MDSLHVLRDLAPYVCLFEHCQTPVTLYDTTNRWLAHLAGAHQDQQSWLCQHCQEVFASQVSYRKHLFDASDMSSEEIDFLVQLNAKSVVAPSCPFCDEQLDTQNETYLHIAEHFRQYALMSLPWDTGIVTLSTKESQNAIANRISEQANSSVARMEDEIANIGDLLFASDTETQHEPANRKGSTFLQSEGAFRALVESPGLSDNERLDATRTWVDGLAPGNAMQAETWDVQPMVEQARTQHDEPVGIDRNRSGDTVLPAMQSTQERPTVNKRDQSLGTPSKSEKSNVDANPTASAIREPPADIGEEHAASDSDSEDSETSSEEDTPIVRDQKQRAEHQGKLPIAAKHEHGKLVPGRAIVRNEPRTQSGWSATRSTMPSQHNTFYAPRNPAPALPQGRLRPNQSASTAQIPWRHSQALGADFIYNPRTDRIHCIDGRQFARPPSIEVKGLMHARYDGPLPPLQYDATLPGNISYMHGVRPETQRHIPTSYPIAPGAALQNLDPGRQPVAHRPTQQLSGSQARQRNPVRVPSSSDRRSTIGNEHVTSTLPRGYSIRQSNFFDVGRVFLVLWAEPTAGASAVRTEEPGTVLNQFGERVISKVRRFVVIRHSRTFCNALPISTYSGRGVSKRGVVKSEHVIIYTSQTAPMPRADELPRRGEDGMRPVPIRVDAASTSEPLDPMSRLDLAGVTTIAFNLKVKPLGKVGARSLWDLMQQFAEVWADDDDDEEEEESDSEEEDEGEVGGRADDGTGDDDNDDDERNLQ